MINVRVSLERDRILKVKLVRNQSSHAILQRIFINLLCWLKLRWKVHSQVEVESSTRGLVFSQ